MEVMTHSEEGVSGNTLRKSESCPPPPTKVSNGVQCSMVKRLRQASSEYAPFPPNACSQPPTWKRTQPQSTLGRLSGLRPGTRRSFRHPSSGGSLVLQKFLAVHGWLDSHVSPGGMLARTCHGCHAGEFVDKTKFVMFQVKGQK